MIDYAAINECVKREFTCKHERICITYLITSAGSKLFRRQCRRCGEQVEVLRKGGMTQAQIDAAIPHDKELQPAWWRRRNKRYEALRDLAEAQEVKTAARDAEARERERAREDAAWRARYNAHLQSPEWRRKRDLVLKRSGGICEGCGERPAAHVHHMTYEHLGDEFLWELRAVCIPCHRRLHPERYQ